MTSIIPFTNSSIQYSLGHLDLRMSSKCFYLVYNIIMLLLAL